MDERERKLRAVLDEHGPMIRRIIASYERDVSQRADLLQDIAIAIWTALPRLKDAGRQRAFIARIAQNRAITHSVRQANLPRPSDAVDVTADVPSLEHQLDTEREASRLLEVVRTLPIDQRRLVVLALEGFSTKEIATEFGITENNAGRSLAPGAYGAEEEVNDMAEAEDWNELRSEWAASTPTAPAIDIDAVKAQIRAANRRILLTTALEALVVVVGGALYARRLLTIEHLEAKDGLIMLVIAVTLAATAWARRGPWTSRGETLEELVRVSEHRARSGLRHATACYVMVGLAAAIIAAVFIREAWLGHPWRNAGLLGFAVIYTGVTQLIAMRKAKLRRQELKEAEALRAQLTSDSDSA